MKTLVEQQATSSTDAVTSEAWAPESGAVSSSFVCYSSAVAGTLVIQALLPGVGWVPYITGEAVTAGEAHVVVVDLPEFRQRAVFTPSAATASVLSIYAASSGQR